MGNALCLSLDELAQESELDVVGHDVWGTLAMNQELKCSIP